MEPDVVRLPLSFEEDDPVAKLYYGIDVISGLRLLPDSSVHCVVTSPPYYGLRDYGLPKSKWTEIEYAPLPGLSEIVIGPWEGCLGLEDNLEGYIGHLVAVFREVKRVLREDGICWLNLGDSYVQKNLMLVPHRVALALQADGWWVRSDVVWSKTNPMPESVTDRPTKSHEYVFLLTKSEQYFYDADAVMEESVQPDRERADRIGGNKHGQDTTKHSDGGVFYGGKTKNRRSVWTISTKPYSGAHFAVMPPDLAEICVKAGTHSDSGCTVLDPFSGSGTVGHVALSLGHNYIGIDLGRDFLPLARNRILGKKPGRRVKKAGGNLLDLLS